MRSFTWRLLKKIDGSRSGKVCPTSQMQYSDMMTAYSNADILVPRQKGDTEQALSAFLVIIFSMSFLLFIYSMGEYATIGECITDKKPAPEPEHESDDVPETPNSLVLSRMCSYGCCPLNESLDTYYARFSTDSLEERKEFIVHKCDSYADIYTKAKDEYHRAKDALTHASTTYSHLVKSSEKLSELYELRTMSDTLEENTVEELYQILAAVHSWKPFVHAPDGLYPYQKPLWEKAILKSIYERCVETQET